MILNFVLLLAVVLGCCGLAADIGLLELKRLQMQNAADAAALGGLYELERNDSAGLSNAAIADAGLNGFVNGSNGVSVSLSTPPSSGSYVGNYGAVQATISQPATAVFMGKSTTIQAQATALMPPCVYLMRTAGGVVQSGDVPYGSYGTLSLANATLAAGCPVYMGNGMVTDSFSTSYAYGYYIGGSSSASILLGPVYGALNFNHPLMSDPLAYITSPTFSTPCNFLNISLLNLNTDNLFSTTLNPGTYCGGITILNSTVTFNPGLYVITGGLNWFNAVVKGAGVTLFLTKGTLFGYGQMYVSGNSVVTLSAPNDSSHGGIPGILIFGDRNWVGTTADVLLDDCSFYGDGIIYFLNTGIYSWNCGMTGPNYFGLDVDNLSFFFSTFSPRSNYSNVSGGNPFRPKESLAE